MSGNFKYSLFFVSFFLPAPCSFLLIRSFLNIICLVCVGRWRRCNFLISLVFLHFFLTYFECLHYYMYVLDVPMHVYLVFIVWQQKKFIHLVSSRIIQALMHAWPECFSFLLFFVCAELTFCCLNILLATCCIHTHRQSSSNVL